MKVEGFVALRLRRPANEGGAYKTVFALHIALPEVFKSGPTAARAASPVTSRSTSTTRACTSTASRSRSPTPTSASSASSRLPELRRGRLVRRRPVHRADDRPGKPQPYIECRSDNTEDRWDGAIAIVLPTASQDRARPVGRPARRRAVPRRRVRRQPRHAVPLAPGVFLQSVRLGVCLEPPPFKVKGGAARLVRADASTAIRRRSRRLTSPTPTPTAQPWMIAADGRCRCSTSRWLTRTSSTGHGHDRLRLRGGAATSAPRTSAATSRAGSRPVAVRASTSRATSRCASTTSPAPKGNGVFSTSAPRAASAYR